MIDKNTNLNNTYITNQGYEIEIIKYYSYKNLIIKFKNDYSVRTNMVSVNNGTIKNPFHPSVYGIGYLGVGDYKASKNRKHTKCYSVWVGILRRCYNENERHKAPTYKDVTVCDEWHNFQNFAKWYYNNWKKYMQDWNIDKDILIKGNKIYSSETCAFVPKEINNLFTKYKKCRGKYPIGVRKSKNKFQAMLGITVKSKHLGLFNTPYEAFQVYKIEKEKHIKEVADKYKGQITERCYQAMYNYKVEITD